MEATGSNETKLLLSWVFKSRICTATSGLLSPREAEVSQSGHLLASCDPNDPVVPPSDRILQRVLAFSESREELLCLVYDKKTEEQSFLALDIRNVSCPKESWSFPQPLASYRQPRHSRSRLNTALTTAAAYDHMTSNFIALLLPEPFIASSAAAIASNGGDALAPDFSSALSEPVVGCILRPPKLMQRLPTTAKQRPDLQFFLCSPISVLGQPIVDDRPESKAFIASSSPHSLAWALQDSILISALPTGSLVYWRLPSETHTPLLFQQHRHFPEHSSDSSTPSELYNDSKVDMRPMSIVCRPLLMHPYHTISPSSCIASKAEGDNGNIAALGKLLVLLSVSPLDTSLLASAVFPCSVKESSSDCPVAPHGAGAGGRVHLWRLRILAGENAGFAADLLAICSPHCEIDLSRSSTRINYNYFGLTFSRHSASIMACQGPDGALSVWNISPIFSYFLLSNSTTAPHHMTCPIFTLKAKINPIVSFAISLTLPLPQPTFLSSQSLQLQPRPQPSRPVTILAVAMLSGQLDVYRLDEPDLPFISLLPPHDESASLLPSSSPSKSSIPNAPLYLIRLASLQVHSSQGVNPTSSVLISSNLETNLIDVPHAKQSMIEDSEKGNAENSEVFDSTLMRTSDCTGDQRKLANERQDAVLYPSKEKTEKKNPIVSGLPATARSVLSVLQASSPTERPSAVATVLPASAAHTVPLPACIAKRRQVSFQPLENPISGRLDLTWAPASMRWPERTSPDVLPIPSPLPLPRTSIIKCDESEPLESKKDPLREEESDDREANESASSFACIVRANRRNASFGCYLDLSSLSHSSCPLEEIDECASSNHPANLPTTPALGNTLTTACTPFAAPPVCGIEGSMVHISRSGLLPPSQLSLPVSVAASCVGSFTTTAVDSFSGPMAVATTVSTSTPTSANINDSLNHLAIQLQRGQNSLMRILSENQHLLLLHVDHRNNQLLERFDRLENRIIALAEDLDRIRYFPRI